MRRRPIVKIGILLVLAVAALPAAAQPTCTGNAHLMSWPDVNPVWQFCWTRPSQSSGPSGSGLEISDVYYRGHLVLKRGHVPMLNVDYNPGGCGCFRDWMFSESSYRTTSSLFAGYFEPPFPAETVCDHATDPFTPPGDCPWGGPGPCNSGVSAEKYADHLVMTTQASAGWYRYTMRWIFYQNGVLVPQFGFGTYNTSCSGATHRHHAYWRLDFDIDGAADDYVTEGATTFTTETSRTWGDGTVTWEVKDSVTGRGYRITPGAQDRLLSTDSFSRFDLLVSLYHSTELQDGSGGCPVTVGDLVNGEAVQNTDVVLYYRGGVQDVVGQDIHDCKTVGPTLTPIGDWGNADIFRDGFESGDASHWSGAQPPPPPP